MDFLLKLIATAAKFVEWATMKKVAMMAVLCLIGLIGFTVYEEQGKLSSPLSARGVVALHRFVVDENLTTQIRTLVSSSAVTMVTVYAADLQLNERVAMYTYSDNALLDAQWRKYNADSGTSNPVFTKDDISNIIMVSVVNGEFSCHKYSETINRLFVPTSAVTHVCYVSLPPYYGSFVGYIEVSLTRELGEIEKQSLGLEMKRLSNDIFFKNIVPGLPHWQPRP